MVTPVIAGTTIANRYLVKGRLGRGGMAVVYHAYDPKLDLDVALKVLPRHVAADPTFIARFQREGQTLAKLSHDHILRLYTLDEDEAAGLYFLVLEYQTGGTLKQRLNGEPWSVEDAVAVLRPVAEALDFAHTRPMPVVHRDLKPANILFGERDKVVVSDFGLARLLAPDDLPPQDGEQPWNSLSGGQLVGTPQYMAPEQAEGRPATPASDRYALGVVAFELLTGTVPFFSDTPQATLIKVATQPLPVPSVLNPAIPPSGPIERALLKSLSRDPALRYASAREFVDALAIAGEATIVITQVRHALEVRGAPEGAAVLLDGQIRGNLPCIIKDVPSGPHVLTVTAAGYQPLEQPVAVPRSEPLLVILQPQRYSVTLMGAPAGAQVTVDSTPAGQLPCVLDDLSAGAHTLSVTSPGYVAAQLELSVPRAEPLTVSLVPQTYSLRLSGSPLGATVELNGVASGTLPSTLSGLSAGTHRLRVTHPGYLPQQREVRVPVTGPLNVTLETAPAPRSAPARTRAPAPKPASEGGARRIAGVLRPPVIAGGVALALLAAAGVGVSAWSQSVSGVRAWSRSVSAAQQVAAAAAATEAAVAQASRAREIAAAGATADLVAEAQAAGATATARAQAAAAQAEAIARAEAEAAAAAQAEAEAALAAEAAAQAEAEAFAHAQATAAAATVATAQASGQRVPTAVPAVPTRGPVSPTTVPVRVAPTAPPAPTQAPVVIPTSPPAPTATKASLVPGPVQAAPTATKAPFAVGG